MKNTIACVYLRIVVSKTISITAALATSGAEVVYLSKHASSLSVFI